MLTDQEGAGMVLGAGGKGGEKRSLELPPCLAQPGHMSSLDVCPLHREALVWTMGPVHDVGEEAGRLLAP